MQGCCDVARGAKACSETLHDLFCLLGLDAGREQGQGGALVFS